MSKKILLAMSIFVLIFAAATYACYQMIQQREQNMPIYNDPLGDQMIRQREQNMPIYDEPPGDAKPIIYLYPTKTTEVTVSLGNPQNHTHTYPKYTDGWTVTAEPNGDLFDKETNRSYYALYWEGLNTIEPNMNEGFVVKGKDTIPFLEEKLAQLGLNEREANEFIIYWLPKLESSSYNFVRFQTMQEQNQNMPLAISPKPDTLIRVMMEFKNLSSPIEVKEQILPPTPNREGFVAVEWGGTDVTTNRVQ